MAHAAAQQRYAATLHKLQEVAAAQDLETAGKLVCAHILSSCCSSSAASDLVLTSTSCIC
jgi:hypothetical protein